MRLFSKLSLAAVLCGSTLLGACGDEGIEALEAVKKKACACKDAACAEAVTKEMMGPASKKTKDMDKAKKIAMEAGACLAKAMTGGAAAPAGETK